MGLFPWRKVARYRNFIMFTTVVFSFYAVLSWYCLLNTPSCAIDIQPTISRHGYLEPPEIRGIERIDWNPHDLIRKDAERTGLGEQGLPAIWKPSGQDAEIAETIKKKYKYNAYLGDQISLERSIGDLRPEKCKTRLFIKDIPEQSVSVIIPFYNEKNSSLLRTLYSIVNRSPADILKEIIIVDDFSNSEELGKPLDDYVKKHLPKVRILRNQGRLGLARSRIVGADNSTGSILVFLDCHIEMNYNWLPPLLELVLVNYRTIACPTVDFIGPDDYRIMTLAEKRCRGSFNWGMAYQRMPVPNIDEMDESDPHPTPIMVGCCFAISRQWWEELGKYDTGFGVWGGEQYELSLKNWQCGGDMYESPCSRAAHIYRDLPYVDEVNQQLDRNFHRVVAVWLDEYKDVVYKTRPSLLDHDPGDVTEQIALRKKLQCKSFQWFLDNVAPDMLEWFPLTEPSALAWGQVTSKYNSSLCLVTSQTSIQVRVGDCTKDKHVFEYTWRRQIAEDSKSCLSAPGDKRFELWRCIILLARQVQFFVWDRQTTGHIVNVISGDCLDFDTKALKPFTGLCDENSPTQSWEFEHYNATRVDTYWRNYALGLSNKNQPHG